MADFFDDNNQDIIIREEENDTTPVFLFRVISVYSRDADEPGHNDNTDLVETIIKKRIDSLILKDSVIKQFSVKTIVSCFPFEKFTYGEDYPVVTNISLDAEFGSVADVLAFIEAINIYTKQNYESFIGFTPYIEAEEINWKRNYTKNVFVWPVDPDKDEYSASMTDLYGMTRNNRMFAARKSNMVKTIAGWCVHLIDRKFEDPLIQIYYSSRYTNELKKLLEAYDKEDIVKTVEMHDKISATYTIYEKMTFPALMSFPQFGRYSSDPAIFAEDPDAFYQNDIALVPEAAKNTLTDLLNDLNTYPGGFLDLLGSELVTKDFDYSDKRVMLTLGADSLTNNQGILGLIDKPELVVTCFSLRNGIYKWSGFDESEEHMKYPDFINSIIENAHQIMSRKNKIKINRYCLQYYQKDKLFGVTLRLGEIYDPIRNVLYVATIGLFGYIYAVIDCLKILFRK